MHQTYTLVETKDENYRTKTLVFDRPLATQPGQYVMAWLPGVDEKPFSVAGEAPLSLMVVAVGPFSERLHNLNVGEPLWVRGPLGRGFHLPDATSRRHLLLVGGGYGVAPLHFLARKAVALGHRIEVCIGARAAADILLAESFAKLGATVHTMTEDGSLGVRGLVTGAVEGVVRLSTPDAVYACGPVPMLSAVEALCRANRLPHQLSWEAHMRCGMGMCGSCEVEGRETPGWLACADGPVSITS